MFQVSLEQMDYRRMELLEFEQKLNRLTVRLGEQARTLGDMESFSELRIWLFKTIEQLEEQLEEQAGQVRELGIALEFIIRVFRGCEERILEHLEDGIVEREDEPLIFVVPAVPGNWSEILKFY